MLQRHSRLGAGHPVRGSTWKWILASLLAVSAGVAHLLLGAYLTPQTAFGQASDLWLLGSALVLGCASGLFWPHWVGAAASPIVIAAVEFVCHRERRGLSVVERVLNGEIWLAACLFGVCLCSARLHVFVRRALSGLARRVSRRSTDLPGRPLCLGCRYCLDGLTVHRCPECGRPFDLRNRRTYTTQERGFERQTHPWRGLIAAVTTVVALLAAAEATFRYIAHRQTGVLDAVSAGDWQTAQRRIEAGYEVNSPTHHELIYPIHFAVEAGLTEIVRLLLDHGANPDASTTSQQTPLHMAAAGGHGEIIDLFLKAGATTDTLDFWGHRPLEYAAARGDLAIVRSLLKAGSDPDPPGQEEDSRRTALQLAAQHGHLEVVLLLLANGADVRARGWQWRDESDNELRIGGKTTYGERMAQSHASALDLAAQNGHVDVLEELVEAWTSLRQTQGRHALRFHTLMSSDGLARPIASDGWPLHWAAAGGHVEAVRLLLSKGALVDCRGSAWGTPLQWAAVFGQTNAVTELIEAGAGLEFQGSVSIHAGNELRCYSVHGTPLHAAAYMGHGEVVAVLIEAGADPTLRNDEGKTARDLALHEGHAEAAVFLAGRMAEDKR